MADKKTDEQKAQDAKAAQVAREAQVKKDEAELEAQMKKDEAKRKLEEKAAAEQLAAEKAKADQVAADKAEKGLKDYQLKFNLRHNGRVIKAGTKLELTDESAAEYPTGVLMPIQLVPTAVDAS